MTGLSTTAVPYQAVWLFISVSWLKKYKTWKNTVREEGAVFRGVGEQSIVYGDQVQ